MVYQANLYLARIKICSDEQIVGDDGALQVIQQQIEERLSGLGFRVLNTERQLFYQM